MAAAEIISFAHSTKNNVAPILSAKFQPTPVAVSGSSPVLSGTLIPRSVVPTKFEAIPAVIEVSAPQLVPESQPTPPVSVDPAKARDYVKSALEKIRTTSQERSTKMDTLREYYKLVNGKPPATSIKKDQLFATLRSELGVVAPTK